MSRKLKQCKDMEENKTTFPKEDNALTRTVYAYVNGKISDKELIRSIKEMSDEYPYNKNNLKPLFIKEVDVDEPRISSYEEACAALGKEPLDEPLMRSQGFRKYEIARRKLETIVAALNFETRQRALEKETNSDNNTQTADTEPVSDVAQPAKVAMAGAEIPGYGL